MKSVLQFVGLFVVLAVAMPFIMEWRASALETRDGTRETRIERQAAAPRAQRQDIARAQKQTSSKSRPRPGQATVPADSRGHFVTRAKLNGRAVDVLIDTGATSVAINLALAKRIGLKVKKKDFKHFANTANGRTPMALATLKSVRIGGVEVKNVEAAVLGDDALDGVLLGMSFLRELKSFSVQNNELRLVR